VPKIKLIAFLSLLSFCFALSCNHHIANKIYDIHQSATTSKAMVVAPHPLATQVGIDVLKDGGTAIDAMVAVQLAIAVVYPRAGNIGGGGFLVYRGSDGTIAALDFREKAPQKADKDMYLDSLGNVVPGLSTFGHLAVGVPGTVDGLFKEHARFGKLDFKRLIQPAIDFAENGFQITEREAKRLNRFQEDFKKVNDPSCVFIKDNWKAGDLLVQKELAQTLRLIRDKGEAGFYDGITADKIIKEVGSGNGIFTKQDLLDYDAKWREPITARYKNYKMISMPPPSSGGVALAQLLGIIEEYPIEQWGFHRVKSTHLMVEAERRVYADRATFLGDADFYPVPLDSLLDKQYIVGRMSDFSPDTATLSSSIHPGSFNVGLESFETTHISIVDAQGNAAAVTTTLNSNFGSKVIVDGAGFFLNNEMDDFSAKPGVPNQFGLVGNEANAIQPGKRMLSSMTPTIFEKDGKLFMVLGSPGGSTIITGVFQVFINVAAFDMSIEEAVKAKRFHHQWLPDVVMYEPDAFDAKTLEKLKKMGHHFKEVNRMAVVKAILVNPDGTLSGAGDPRNPDDDVKGY